MAHYIEQWRFSHRIPLEQPNFPKPDHGFKYIGPDDFAVPHLRPNGKALPTRPYAIKTGMHGIISRVEPMRSWVRFQNFRSRNLEPVQCWLPNSLIVVSKDPSPGHFNSAHRPEDLQVPDTPDVGGYDSTLWIKDELWVADPDPLAPTTTYRLSNFTKSTKSIANYSKAESKKPNGETMYWYAGTFFCGPYEKGEGNRRIIEVQLQTDSCNEEAHVNDVVDGETLPKPDTEYVTQIEVLEDFDRQHPASFTRLQSIDAWEDSMRAKSFAISIHWQDDDKVPRQRYLQYSSPSTSWSQKVEANDFVPGCQTAYELGIALSHWQYGDPHQRLPEKSSNPEWQRECSSQMVVKVKRYEPLTWELTLDDPQPLENIPSEAKVPWSKQRAQIESATYQAELGSQRLLTVDEAGTTEAMTELPQDSKDRTTQRRKCDTCYMINNQECVKKEGHQVCNTCLHFGRERCTWSQGCPTDQQTPWGSIGAMNGVELRRSAAFRSALLDQKPFNDYVDEGSRLPMVGRIIKS